ncbi:MAG TPA: hypothetical protein DCL86_05300, partial [Bacteroidales bacterium]|nr:hypothetical protein [Bacteroidales bacterium]
MKNLNLLFMLLLSFFIRTEVWAQGEDMHFGNVLTVSGFADRSKPIPLQKVIDQTPPGKYVKLEPGFYTGPVVINKDAITIDGNGKVTISGLNKGSVIYLEANNVNLKGLHLIESGGSH